MTFAAQLVEPKAALAAPLRALLELPLGMWIDGVEAAAQSGALSDCIDPASGQVVARVALGDGQDVERAVAAARRAFDGGPWRALRPVERERLMLRLADLMERDADLLAQLEVLDNGKVFGMARHGDLAIAIDTLRYMAGWATKIEGTTIAPSFSYIPGMRFASHTIRQPVGVVAGIIPWNFPLVMAIWKIAPALAAGCTVVLKPAE